jgi:hypothetical protein
MSELLERCFQHYQKGAVLLPGHPGLVRVEQLRMQVSAARNPQPLKFTP